MSRVGRYRNVRSSDATGEPHEYGYTVELWRAGECLFGVLFVHEGLEGDPPRGRIQSVRYDPTSGRLSFKARLTYREYSGGTIRVSSEREYSFSGRLGPHLLAGEIVFRTLLPPSALTTKEQARLRDQPDPELPAFRSYGEWEAWAIRIWRLRRS